MALPFGPIQKLSPLRSWKDFSEEEKKKLRGSLQANFPITIPPPKEELTGGELHPKAMAGETREQLNKRLTLQMRQAGLQRFIDLGQGQRGRFLQTKATQERAAGLFKPEAARLRGERAAEQRLQSVFAPNVEAFNRAKAAGLSDEEAQLIAEEGEGLLPEIEVGAGGQSRAEADAEARQRTLGPLVGEQSLAFLSTAAARETLGPEKTRQLGSLIGKTGGALVIGAGVQLIAGELSLGKFLGGKTSTATRVSEKSVQRVANLNKISVGQARKRIAEQLLKNDIASAVKGTDMFSLAKKTLPYFGALASGDALFQWYALDNVMTGAKFYLKDVASDLEDGFIDNAQALAAVNESSEVREIAINKIRFSSTVNPLLWPFRKLMLTGADADERAIILIEDRINNFILEGSVGGMVSPRNLPQT